MMNNVLKETIDNDILTKFMRGAYQVIMMDKIPEGNYQHIEELDVTDKTGSYRYYYDAETDTIGCVQINESVSNHTSYRGAYIYEIEGGYEANLKGFHYDAKTLDELKSKIDNAIETNDFEKTLQLYSAEKGRALPEDVADQPRWEAVYGLPEAEIDDDFNDNNTIKIIFKSPDEESAQKYAEQYLRKLKLAKSAAIRNIWAEAQLLSVHLV